MPTCKGIAYSENLYSHFDVVSSKNIFEYTNTSLKYFDRIQVIFTYLDDLLYFCFILKFFGFT